MAPRFESSVGPARLLPSSLAVLIGIILLLSSASPAAAQEADTTTSSSTTSSSTTSSLTSLPLTSEAPPISETTVPPAVETTVPLPQEETTPTDPGGSTDGSAVPEGTDTTISDDPMSHEEPGEEAPATDITVPPKTTYEGQEPFKPAEILWSSVAAAERKLDDAIAAKQDAIVEVRALRKRYKSLGAIKQELEADTAAAIDELMAAEQRLKTRAVFGYQRFGSGSEAASDADLPDMSDYRQILDSQRKSKMVGSALDADESDLEELAVMRSQLGTEAVGVLDRARLVSDFLIEAESKVSELDHKIDQATIEYEGFRAGSEVFIHGVVFPIGGPYPTPLIDSYGFPRMPGTPDEHWHEGIDLFADRGTPLVATERGVITKLGVGRLGGLKFWLKGESGSEWYYAHLDSFAPGLADGVVVEAGQLVGYVGNTGNALTTPAHLHMQLHPSGDQPVNPYPLLKVVSDLERAEMQAGTHAGYQYPSVRVDR